MIVAVTGRLSAGETTVCSMLGKHGFKRISLSDLLRERLREQGEEVTRANLRALGDKLRKEMGMSAMAQLAWEKMRHGGDWVVDSVYTTAESEFLRGHGAVLVGVVAPPESRYERMRARDGEFSSFEEFVRADDRDQNLGIDKMVASADYVLSNDGTMEELEALVSDVLESISSRAQK